MVFSSLVFLYAFLPLNFIFYFLSKNQTYRNWVLIIFSLAFYAWGEPVWVSLLIFSSLVDYFLGLATEKYRGHWQSKAALLSSITVNLSLLGFFKYSDFLIQNLNYLLGTGFFLHNFGLPIGISFYTFQTISYVVDVYRGEVTAQKSFPKFLLFISLFHQLVAGPIVRYKDIAYAIDHRVHSLSQFNEGINRFITGLGKKIILANTAGEIAEVFLNGDLSTLPVLGAWFGITLFALQIYFDFSAYSDMALGLGKIFGFNYKENFNYPYISRSATEFWRRWHISLGSFFRDYLYIPLGGNRKHYLRNLLIVWFLTGLWHGASWNFILWGLYFGILIALEKKFLGKILENLPRWVAHGYLIFAVLISWVFFYYTDLHSAGEFLGVMFAFGSRQLIDTQLSIYFCNNLLFFLLALLACTPITKVMQKGIHYLTEKNTRVAFLYGEALRPSLNFVLLALATILLVGKSYNPFLYFRF
ncbi:MAG: MBOAT family protein [Clostridia bacterium]|nr:MBOAT family protein [Clostridia bacterium]MDD4145512.1 MBOAT family protein [Clostridia bacterium]MDD4665009.1 MBOAT family protein [Clostridia bacterium]